MTPRTASTVAPGLIVAALLVAGIARAQGTAPADTALHQFLDSLADSTDRYFGTITSPVDTAGLDSALAVGLVSPWRPSRRVGLSYYPRYRFLRVDGSLWGAGAAVSERRSGVRLGGELGYTDRSHTWLGGGELSVRRGREESWRLAVAGGRRTEPINRDWDEFEIAALRALTSGNDNQSYLRRDGFTAGLTRVGGGWRAALKYRDWREAPLTVRTTYNFAHEPPENPRNLPATPGRVREIGIDGLTRVPGTQFRAQVGYRLADGAIGSDFDYQRTRAALAGDIAAGRHISLVPQFAYGRLTGDPVPQAAFYLGGPGTLRSIPTESLGGTGLAIARLDVIGTDDVLALMHLPHPAMFPIQAGLFAATGAAWGVDPFGGPGSTNGGWPDRGAWRSEAGAQILYRPGIPDGDAYVRVNVAWTVGPVPHQARWTVTYSRALDLMKPF